MTKPLGAEHIAVGAYVLGALSEPERQEFETHLAGCERCRAEIAELTPLGGALGTLTIEEISELDSPEATAAFNAESSDSVARLLERAAKQRRAQRRRSALAIAASIVIASGVTGGAVAIFHDGGGQPGPTRVLTSTDPLTHVKASIALRSEKGGTTAEATLTGVPTGERCRLVVIGKNGRRETAATWHVNYDGSANVSGTTSLGIKEITSVEVIGNRHGRLASVRVS